MNRRRAFVLLEAMVAVAIFSIGVLTLGRCVSNCLAAEQFKAEDARARRVLENRLAEIEAYAIPIDKPLREDLKEPFAGVHLEQTPASLRMKNEKGEELTGLVSIHLQASWRSGGEKFSKELVVYVQSR